MCHCDCRNPQEAMETEVPSAVVSNPNYVCIPVICKLHTGGNCRILGIRTCKDWMIDIWEVLTRRAHPWGLPVGLCGAICYSSLLSSQIYRLEIARAGPAGSIIWNELYMFIRMGMRPPNFYFLGFLLHGKAQKISEGLTAYTSARNGLQQSAGGMLLQI